MSGVQNCVERIRRASDRTAHTHKNSTVQSYGAFSVFTIGMLHGIGAETGTQVLLIAAVGGASTHGFGIAMLLSFIVGLLTSNTIIAMIATNGLARSTQFQRVYLASSALVAVFSLIVGTFFVLGASSQLPDIQLALRGNLM
jgi:high-affinity nickel-transport protein